MRNPRQTDDISPLGGNADALNGQLHNLSM